MAGAFDDEVTVEAIRWGSEATGWAVLEASLPDGTGVTLVGPLIHLEPRERAQITGEWVNDSRFGLQVKVAEARPLPPSEPAAVTAYLRRVRHVGLKRAEALMRGRDPAALLDAIDADPAGEFARAGMSAGRIPEAVASWVDLRRLRRLHLLLAPHGLGYLVGRINERFGARAADVVLENPYELTSAFGVGFALADRIARGAPVPVPPLERARAAVLHALAEAERDGSTCLPLEQALGAAGLLLGGPVEDGAVPALLEAGLAVLEDGHLYRRATAELEAELAAQVLARVGPREPHVKLAAATSPAAAPDGLSEEQATAVRVALEAPLSVVTGGPGTGKTSTIRAVVAAATDARARVMLLAPTGRAAARMAEASGVRASTVHSALAWIPGEGAGHDAEDPLSCDLLILDESSMANLELLVTLLRAVPAPAHVVLVGDADQLAPVGAGKPFAELVDSGSLPVTRLTHIFRQAADSMIVQGAHAIRAGRVPDFRPAEGMRRDLFMIERADPPAARAEIVELVAGRLPGHYGVDPIRDIQVFAPVYRGELGIDALNLALREALNPDGRPVGGGRLRIGDKLMMTGRNLHDLGLMNGTVLRLIDEVPDGEDEAALLLAGEETVFRLPHEEVERLRLAYACSVHRGQGIELPVAVIVAHPAAGARFLRREMLYTAVTRARLATVLVGRHETLARAVAATDTGRRRGRLAARVLARRD